MIMAFAGSKISFLQILVITLINLAFSNDDIDSHYQLPTAIFPTKYRLHINTEIHRNISTYNGSVTIDLTVRESTNEIVLNAKQLRQFNITLTNFNTSLTLKSPELQYKLDEEKEQLKIFWPLFPLKLKIGQEYRLRIEFVGNLQEKEAYGFFKTIYLGEKNNSIPIAATHFEPIGARFAFPCFDEPAFKAKFTTSITHGSNYSAVSNMPVNGKSIPSTANEQMLTTTFLESPNISTYLIAFAITNYKKLSVLVNGLEHRFFLPTNSKENASQIFENAIKTVAMFEKYIGIKYSLPKLDHIEVGKTSGLAMENWGLMFFSKPNILLNYNDYNKKELLDQIILQSHEIAHQWFGNLVTPKSWSYLWLKEGFATFFSYFVTDLIYPKEKIFEHFITNEVSELYVTPYPLTRPMTNVIKEGDDVSKYFDTVAYNLGGAFLRMFYHAIGQSTFLKGISKYLLKFQYSIADENDFFEAIQAAVDEDQVNMFQNKQSIANIMRTWTHNHGIPTVRITRNYDTGTITIRQKPNKSHFEEKWWIPLNFATTTNPDFERTIPDYIMPPQTEVILDLKNLNISLSNSDWLIVNKQQTGIFNVVYDDLNLKLITEALQSNHTNIHLFNRALIFQDLSATFDEELGAVEPLLTLLQYLKLEEESLPWLNAADLMLKLISRLKDNKSSEKFKNFLNDISIEIFKRKYENLSDNLTAIDWQMKNKMVELNFQVDTKSCRNYTFGFPREYFFKEINKTKRPCASLLCREIKNATFEEIKAFINRAMKLNPDLIDFHQFMAVLKCFESVEHFNYLDKQLLSKEYSDDLQTAVLEELVSSNTLFRKWFTRMNRRDEERSKRFFEVVDEENSKEAKNRERFLRKYENNIYAWLENYEKSKRHNSGTSVLIT